MFGILECLQSSRIVTGKKSQFGQLLGHLCADWKKPNTSIMGRISSNVPLSALPNISKMFMNRLLHKPKCRNPEQIRLD